MALTRAQLLAGNSSQGVVLPGQVQAVTEGAGINIDASGVISLDGSDPAFNGFIKTNNAAAFNAYVWPGVDGTADQFLQTDGAGNLTWADAAGFAVVTVSNIAPSPPDEGELWFDCNTGTLKVYQNCVTPPGGWTSVAEPGLPVLPINTSAAPAFTGGNGTLATPYDCTVTTAAVGSTVFVVNTVTIINLAPYQYVPIIDLNAYVNGGRFSFTNNYADAGGVLTFQTIFRDSPSSPPATSYTAAIKVGYGTVYIDAIVNLVTPVSLTSPGTISGNPLVGDTLTYTPGTAVNGVAPYTYTWDWKKLSDGSVLQSGSGTAPQTYVIPASLIGDNVYVELLVTDSIGGTDTGVTSLVPTPPATIQRGPFPVTPINFPTTIPGTANTTWNEPGSTSISATDCLEFEVNGGGFTQGPVTINNGDTLTTRWIVSALCGNAASGTTINGCIQSASYEECSSLAINRIPSTFPAFTPATGVALNGISVSNTVTPTGYNSTAYVTLGAASTGTNVRVSLDGGGTWFVVPAAGSTTLPINPGQTLTVEQTVGATVSTGYTAIINIGDGTGSTSQTFTATTVATATFPNFSTTPAGGPNASPAITSLAGPSLYGTAVGAAWADGFLNLTATGSLQFKVGAGAFTQASTAVVNGNIVSLAWNPTAAVTTNGTVLTGDLLGGPYTNSYTVTVDNQPDAYTWTDVPAGAGGSAVSTVNTSNLVNITGINAPAELIYTPDGTNPLTSVQAAINGGAWTNIPTASPGLVINPADSAGTTATTLQIRGTTGAALNTAYKITTKIGDGTTWVTDEWSVGTVAATPTITAPTIVTPAANTTGVGTASGITITGSAYTPNGGAGSPQTSSKWEVYKNSYPLQSANTITGVAQGGGSFASLLDSFTGGTTYFGGSPYPVGLGTSTIVCGPRYSLDNGSNWNFSTTAPVLASFGKYAKIGETLYGVAGAGATATDVRKTTDGFTWVSVGTLPTATYGNATVVTDGANLLVTTSGGILRSTNLGVNWSFVSVSGMDATNASNLSYVNGAFIARPPASSTLYSSTDGGATWSPITSNLPTGFITWAGDSLVYANGSYLFAGRDTPANAMCYRSTDLITWTPTQPTSTSTYTSFFGPSAIGDTMYVGCYADSSNRTLFESSDGGVTWSGVSTPWDTLGAASFGSQFINNKLVTAAAVSISTTWYIAVGTPANTILTIAGCQTEGFLAGDTVVSVAAGGGPATILSLDNTQVTVTSSTGWAIGQALARDSSSYTAVTGSPFTVTTGTLTSLTIPKPPLEANQKYWVRAQYATTNAAAATSPFGGWSDFTTGTLVPTPGDLYGGGYFAGQINDSGTIYNLVVAPKRGDVSGPNPAGALYGEQGSVEWRIDTTTDAAAADNQDYGKPWTDTAGAVGAPTYPLFGWCIQNAAGPNAGASSGGTGIGGFNDWYIPAKNELAVVYFFLKPDGTANNTSSGSNPNSVAPYTPNTNYGSGFPNVTGNALFAGGTEAFSTTVPSSAYWSATQSTGNGIVQVFTSGWQVAQGKNNLYSGRAIRRVSA